MFVLSYRHERVCVIVLNIVSLSQRHERVCHHVLIVLYCRKGMNFIFIMFLIVCVVVAA